MDAPQTTAAPEHHRPAALDGALRAPLPHVGRPQTPRGQRRPAAYVPPVSYHLRLGRRLITELCYGVPDAVDTVVKSLRADWTGRLNPADIVDVIITSAAELADRTSLYASLVAALCIADGTTYAATTFLQATAKRLESACQAGQWRTVKLLVRFLGELAAVNVIANSGQALVPIFSAWLAAMQSSMSKLERRDTFAILILSTLPWCAAALGRDQANDLLQAVAAYVGDAVRSPRLEAAKSCRLLANSEHDDQLALLLAQVKNCSDNGWQTPLIVHGQVQLESSLAAPLPSVNVVPNDGPSIVYAPVKPAVTLLTDGLKPPNVRLEYALPAMESIDRFVLYDVVDDVVHAFQHNVTEGCRYLMDTTMFPALAGTAPQCPWSLDQVVVELLATNILRLPQPETKSVFYSTFIVFLCLHARARVPRVLGAIFYTLYGALDTQMDAECQFRFQKWFAHHIANFDYRWQWADWSDALALPLTAPKSLFIQEVLEMCVRLSYYERVTKTLPAGLDIISLMPPQPRPHFRYESRVNRVDVDGGDDVKPSSTAAVAPQLVAFADRLIEAMRLKQSVDEMHAHVTELAQYAATHPGEWDGQHLVEAADSVPGMGGARDVTLQCILFLGAKSFSHTLNILERQSPLLHFLNKTEADKQQTIRTVAQFWQYNKQMMVIVLDKMINYKIIDPSSVISWLFSPDNMAAYNRAYIWSLLKAVVTKLNTRITLIEEKLAKSKVDFGAIKTEQPTTTPAADGDDAMQQDEQDTEMSPRKATAAAAPAAPAAMPLYTPMAKSQEALDNLKREQKQTFITVFQHFVAALAACTTPEDRFWLEGMMREFGRHFHVEMQTFAHTVEMMVFAGAQVDTRAKQIFQQVRQLHA